MRKRLTAIILVVAMVASCLPVGVFAESSESEVRHPHTEAGYTGHVCHAAHCTQTNVTWVAWESTNTIPTGADAGGNTHYYLTGNVTVTARQDILAGSEVTICLNGYTITETNNTTYQNLSYVNGKLTIKPDEELELTVSLEGASYVYDAEEHALPKAAKTNAFRHSGGHYATKTAKTLR